MRYQAFNIVHLSRYNKYKTGHFEVGAGGGAKYLLVIIQSKLRQTDKQTDISKC